MSCIDIRVRFRVRLIKKALWEVYVEIEEDTPCEKLIIMTVIMVTNEKEAEWRKAEPLKGKSKNGKIQHWTNWAS